MTPDQANIQPEHLCKYCGRSSTEGLPPKVVQGLTFATRYCDRCEEYSERWPAQDKRPERRILEWNMPPAYMETDPNRLHQKQLQEALKWAPGKHGLLLVGVTRAGKTRTMMEVVKRQLTYGRRVSYWPAVELGKKISDSFNRKGEHAEFMANLKRANILFVDDLGKEKLTPQIEASLFDVIRDRCDWHRPIFVTTNFSGNQLVKRFSARETAIPMVERLREYCHQVAFTERIPEAGPQQETLPI